MTRGYGSGDTRALMGGWTTVAPDVKVRFVDDAIEMVAKTRGLSVADLKLKNASIDIPLKLTNENNTRDVVIEPAVDLIMLGFYSGYDEQIIISEVAGETLVPLNIVFTSRPIFTPVVLLKGKKYKFTIKTATANANSDLLMAGIQVGDIPTDLVQYSITSDTGTNP